MPRDVRPYVLPAAGTAVLVVEMQQFTAEATVADLGANTRAIIPAIARLTTAARDAGSQVVYALMAQREDGRVQGRRDQPAKAAMRPQNKLADGLVFDERDFMLYRWHGWSPLYDGGVEALLRQMGTRTVIVTGVSLNVSLPAAAITLASGGFQVVVPADCVAAAQTDYGEMVLRHTMRVITTVTTSDEIIGAWTAPHHAETGARWRGATPAATRRVASGLVG